MKILVTGGTGYIGSHTTVELLKLGYEVDIVDNLSNSKESVVDRIEKITGIRPNFFNCDVCDYEKISEIIKNGNYESVIHFAGLKAVGESVEQPIKYYETNILSTLNLLKAMREYDVKKIIFSSSATVYGESEITKFSEDLPTGRGIASPYGETKYMIEQILKANSVAWPDLEVTILRYFNPIGAHSSGLLGEDPNGRPNNLMPIIMRVATGKIKKLQVYGNDYKTRDGSCIRDYIHVVDLANGHIKAIEHSKPGVNIYNLGTGEGSSVLEMVQAFEKASGNNLPCEIVGRRAGDLAEICADPSKAERELGWKAELTIDDAMRDTINFINNESK